MSENGYSVAIKLIGVLLIITGVIIFIILMSQNLLLQAFIYLISSIVVGLIFEGFGEIINLLQTNNDMQHIIYKNLCKSTDKEVDILNAPNRKLSPNEWKCSECGRINQEYVGTCGCGKTKPR